MLEGSLAKVAAEGWFRPEFSNCIFDVGNAFGIRAGEDAFDDIRFLGVEFFFYYRFFDYADCRYVRECGD